MNTAIFAHLVVRRTCANVTQLLDATYMDLVSAERSPTGSPRARFLECHDTARLRGTQGMCALQREVGCMMEMQEYERDRKLEAMQRNEGTSQIPNHVLELDVFRFAGCA